MPTIRSSFSAALRLKLSSSLIAAFLVLPVCLVSGAQAPPPSVGAVGDNVQPPKAGIGHDYIHLMSETVNPANGSLSIRINFPAPKGRGMTPPAYAAYNSGELDSLLDNAGSLMWSTAPPPGSVATSGWGTAAGQPLMASYSTWNWQFQAPIPPNITDPNPQYFNCNYLSGLSLTDLNGTQHTLEVGAAALPRGVNNGNNTSCQGGLANAQSGDNQVTAVLPLDTATDSTLIPGTGLLSNGFQVPVFVIDKEGNTYNLGSTNSAGSYSAPVGIEDRNGNQLGFNSTDTAGRQLALQVGVGTRAGTYNIYGLPYTVATTTTTVNYTPKMGLSIENEGTNPQCPVGPNGIAPANSATMTVISSIGLPNGQKYQFYYGDNNPDASLNNPYGLLSEIIYPDGGWVKYNWQLSTDSNGSPQYTHYSSFPGMAQLNQPTSSYPNPPLTAVSNLCSWYYQTPVVSKRTVSYDGSTVAQTQTFSYNTAWSEGSWTAKTSQVTTADNVLGNSFLTAYAYAPVMTAPGTPFSTGCGDCLSPMEQTVQRYDWGNSSTPLDTATKAWYNTFELACEFHTNANNQTSGHFYQYSNGTMVDDKEYDFTNGATAAQSCTPAVSNNTLPATPPIRETVTTLQAITSPVPPFTSLPAGSRVTPNQAFYKPSTVTLYYNGAAVAETTYGYDESLPVAVSGVINHDEVHFGSNVQQGRGNLTSIHKLCVGSAPCTPSTTTYIYDETGQVVSMTDPLQNTTTYSYADSFSSGTPPGQTNAYVTKITNALSQKATFQYTWMQGDLTSSKDANGQSTGLNTQYFYDASDRLTETLYPDGGQTQIAYNDPTTVSSSNPPSVTTTKLLTSSLSEISVANMDGMGHVVQSIVNDPAEGKVTSETTYDGEGRAYTKTNPHRPSLSSTTDGTSKSYYDALGRPTLQIHPDSNSLTWCYDGVASIGNTNGVCKSHIGGSGAAVTWVDNQDESGNQWQRSSDGLGRLIQVEEPNGNTASASMETDYAYDGLGNLTSVTQQGSGSSGTRARSFSYNSLSQLLTSNNPETGTITYGPYDANGNLTAKIDARSIKVSYQYDALNRLYARNYNNGDPSACMQYDVALSGASDSNPLGALTAEWTAPAGTCPATTTSPVSSIPSTAYNSTVAQSHDSMGRTLLEKQCPYTAACNSTYQFKYAYDRAGGIVQYNNGMPESSSSTAAPALNWGIAYMSQGGTSTGQLGSFGVVQFPDGQQGQPWGSPNSPDLAHPFNLIQAFPSTTAPAYDPLGHLVNAQLAINPSNSSSTINVLRQYDNRGRILSETDGGSGVTASSGSTGAITVAGNEASPLSSGGTSGSGTLTVTGADGVNQVCTTVYVPEGPYHVLTPITVCNYVPDTGTLSVTINGFTASVSYGAGSSDSALASQLAAGFNMSGSPVTALASGSAFTVTAIAKGTASNYPISFSNGDYSVSDPNSTLTGGQTGASVYDAGTATATISGNGGSWTATANWGQGSTASSLASSLASAINGVGGSPVTASASGSTVNLTGTGATVSVSIADTQSATFPTPSFSASVSGMSGGGGSGNGNAYAYQVGGYAPNGNILSHTDSVMGAWSFGYDTLNRLIAANAGASVPAQFAGQYGCWTYDPFGNRLLEAYSTATSTPCASGAYDNTQQMNTPQSSASNNRLSTLTYDLAGNVTYDSVSGNQYAYDGEGRLCAVYNNLSAAEGKPPYTQYIYDAGGVRVAKGSVSSLSCGAPGSNGFTLTNQYLLDLGGEQVTELGSTGNWVHSNAFAGGRLTGTYDSDGKGVHLSIADPLGTKRVQLGISSSGTAGIDENCYSLPFGNNFGNTPQTDCVGPGVDATEHHFTGKERDTESGNDYFGARYYSSAMGRFMSPDWSAKIVPVPYAKLGNPQSLNLYAYLMNNPLGGVDADGHTANCAGANAATCAADLNKLAPGTKVAADGTVSKGSLLQRIVNHLDGNGAGQSLVSRIVNDSHLTTITADPGNPNGGTQLHGDVKYDPAGANIMTRGADGNLTGAHASGTAVLGHELIHQDHENRGLQDMSAADHVFSNAGGMFSETVNREEFRTTGFSPFVMPGDITENQLERQLGAPVRATYTGPDNWVPVPQN